MKKNLWITLIAGFGLGLGIFALPVSAQQATLPTRVAIIDLEQVIKAHPEFIQKQTDLEKKGNEIKAMIEQQKAAIEGKQKNLASSPHKQGSAEYQQMMDVIANDIAELEKFMKTEERKFTLESSKVMFDTYKNIKETIAQIAVPHGIAQVTDYRQFEANPLIPDTVAADMDQRLVWFSPQLNITQPVIEQLYKNRGMTPPPPAATNAATAAVPRTATAPAAGVRQ